MSFEVFINCDLCKSRAQVPQMNNLPKGWIGMSYPTTSLNGTKADIIESKVFCGWSCTHKFTKGFIRERAVSK